MAFKNGGTILHTLENADGSATYESPSANHTIIAGINYPVEVPYRSDEIPDSTYIEVNLRPHNAVGMVKERHVEELVRRTLQAVMLGEETPRTMLQAILQVADVEADEKLPGGVKAGGQGESYLDILAGAINAAILGCLDAGVQMRGLAGAALVGLSRDGELIAWPSVIRKAFCQSLHVFVYDSRGACLLMESEGAFDISQWESAETAARMLVLGQEWPHNNGEDISMQGTEQKGLLEVWRKSVEARVEREERWRGG